jgi:hypothetical protein
MKYIEANLEHTRETFSAVVDQKFEENKCIESLRDEVRKMNIANENLKQKQDEQEETILDIQCRSMENNLIFFGIEETNLGPGEYENTQDILKSFISKYMAIDEEILFQKVHRLGRRKADQIKPRPIIAKFKDLKQKDLIKYSAPSLKNTKFAVRDQFPKKIEDRRKVLYTEMRAAKDKGSNVKLVRDRLYIDNKRFFLTNTDGNHNTNQAEDEPNRSPANTWRQTQYNKSKNVQQNKKVFYNSNRHLQFSTPISTANRFQALSDNMPENRHQNKHTGKRDARSPLDHDLQTKKQREEPLSEDSGESDLEIRVMSHNSYNEESDK